MTSTPAPPLPDPLKRTPRRAAIAAWIGSALEYYDFAVYGTAAALVLNKLFFPADAPPAVSVLFAMGTVGVAYVVRPLGALVMGPLADRLGRRFVLMLTLFLIGAATFSIGCLPTYEQAGYLAPALLVLCRMVQGLSAAGEQASAISMSLEHADEGNRGFIASWTLQGTQFGTLLATIVFIPIVRFLPEPSLDSWGWRVPFWMSAFVVVTAYVIRRKLEEPPGFEEMKNSGVTMTPLVQTLRFHKAAVARVAVASMINTVNMVFTVFSVSFATNGVGLDRSTMLWVPVLVNVVALGAIPVAARIADKVGRKPVFVVGTLGPAIVMYPYLWAITTGNWPLIFALGILMSGLLYSAANAIWPAFYAEMFPTRVRATGLALGTQIGFALSGGFAPAAATLLSGDDLNGWFGPAAFVSAMCLLSMFAALTAKETAPYTLDQIDDLQVSPQEAEALRESAARAPSAVTPATGDRA